MNHLDNVEKSTQFFTISAPNLAELAPVFSTWGCCCHADVVEGNESAIWTKREIEKERENDTVRDGVGMV